LRELVLSTNPASSSITGSRPCSSSTSSTIGTEKEKETQDLPAIDRLILPENEHHQVYTFQSSKEEDNKALRAFYEQRQQPLRMTATKEKQKEKEGATHVVSRTVKNLKTLKASSSGSTDMITSLPKNLPTPTPPPPQITAMMGNNNIVSPSFFVDMNVPKNYAYLVDSMPTKQSSSTSISSISTTALSEKELFEEFKQQTQSSSAGDLELSKQNLKKAKKKLHQMGIDVNTLKMYVCTFV
jgi:hypothetical protein